MESFRIPGEAQIIERIFDVWCRKAFSTGKFTVFANEEACFVLSYFTMLLNVDQHSPQVTDRMTFV